MLLILNFIFIKSLVLYVGSIFSCNSAILLPFIKSEFSFSKKLKKLLKVSILFVGKKTKYFNISFFVMSIFKSELLILTSSVSLSGSNGKDNN
ncbi:MAG: hypothetical protein LBF97_01870 [Elusimicrobiota bacterium]|jgi:hypothetical protein|nr:hypothetical protein [Elusimicrobiota bacterium]